MRVKICGITSYQDAMDAINAGADALGFVFYSKSPRYISPENAAQIIEKLPPFVEKVGLFVNESAKQINAMAKTAKITLAQLHFEITSSEVEQLEVPYLHVIRATSQEDVLQYADSYRLVDAYCEAYGGVGKRVNLEWFKNVDCSNIILAGGLSADNIHEIAPYHFFGADVSSAVEKAKGIKDSAKVKAFITGAKC